MRPKGRVLRPAVTNAALGAAGIRRPEPLLGRVQHVQHAEMALIFGIKGREVFRRALCELLDVEALVAGGRQRHRRIHHHLERNEAACNDERRCEHEWLCRHGFLPEFADGALGLLRQSCRLCRNSVMSMFRLNCSLYCGDDMVFAALGDGKSA